MTLVSDDAGFRHRPYPFAPRIEQFMRLDKDGQHARAIIAASKIDRIETWNWRGRSVQATPIAFGGGYTATQKSQAV